MRRSDPVDVTVHYRILYCPLHRDAAATARRLAEVEAERDALRAELCRFYRADGTWEVEPTPEAAIARRKLAAVVLEWAQATERDRADLLAALRATPDLPDWLDETDERWHEWLTGVWVPWASAATAALARAEDRGPESVEEYERDLAALRNHSLRRGLDRAEKRGPGGGGP